MMKRFSIPFRLIRIDKNGYHPVCIIQVNGINARFVVDTGASQTIMDSNRIALFADDKTVKNHNELSTGLGTSSMVSKRIKIKTLTMGNAVLENFKMILLDLSHVNHTYSLLNYKPIDGVLGNDILKNFGAVISFQAKTISINIKKTRFKSAF